MSIVRVVDAPKQWPDYVSETDLIPTEQAFINREFNRNEMEFNFYGAIYDLLPTQAPNKTREIGPL